MEFVISDELARQVGNSVVRAGWLGAIRQHLGLSGNAMAAAIGTYPGTYRTWEGVYRSRDRDLRQASAETIGRFYFVVLTQLAFLRHLGLTPADLVPISQVAIRAGMAVTVIQDRCTADPTNCVDLGPLGTFMRRKNVGGPV